MASTTSGSLLGTLSMRSKTVALSKADFITHQYHALFSRAPDFDVAEKQSDFVALDSLWGRFDYIHALVGSQEGSNIFKSDPRAFIAKLAAALGYDLTAQYIAERLIEEFGNAETFIDKLDEILDCALANTTKKISHDGEGISTELDMLTEIVRLRTSCDVLQRQILSISDVMRELGASLAETRRAIETSPGGSLDHSIKDMSALLSAVITRDLHDKAR